MILKLLYNLFEKLETSCFLSTGTALLSHSNPGFVVIKLSLCLSVLPGR